MCFLLIFSVIAVPVMANDSIGNVVLISAADKQVPEFTNKELRLLFLGYPVTKASATYKPLINASNQLVYSMFLQKVMYMTESRYERQLLSRVFRYGGERPVRYDDKGDLIRNLKKRPNAITFVNANITLQLDGVKIVQQLW